MEWDGAYYWPESRPIQIDEAIKKRDKGELEAGDCWCHEDCYHSQPRRGTKIFPRNRKSCPHFWRGPGKFIKKGDCEFYDLQVERSESTRYSQFYHDCRSWLRSDSARNELHFQEFREVMSKKYSDFVLVHDNDSIPWEETEILIVHKNRRRKPQTKDFICIDISQWTKSDLANFNEFGVRKILEEFQQLITQKEFQRKLRLQEIEQKAAEEMRLEKERENEAAQIEKKERLKQVQIQSHRDSIEEMRGVFTHCMNDYVGHIRNHPEMTEYRRRVRAYDQNYQNLVVWDDEHKNIIEKGRELRSYFFGWWFHGNTNEPTDGNESSYSKYGHDAIPFFKKLKRFLKIVDYSEYKPQTKLRDIAHQILAEQDNEIKNELDEKIDHLIKLQEDYFAEFNRKYPYHSQIKEFYDVVDSRINYFYSWIAEYIETSHPTKTSSENRNIVESRLHRLKEIKSMKSFEERLHEYHVSEFNSAEEYVSENISTDLLTGVEKCHRMMKMTLSDWRDLLDK